MYITTDKYGENGTSKYIDDKIVVSDPDVSIDTYQMMSDNANLTFIIPHTDCDKISKNSN